MADLLALVALPLLAIAGPIRPMGAAVTILVTAAIVTATVVSTGPFSGPSEPPAIAGQGYEISFEDDFDTFDTAKWTDHSYWTSPERGAVVAENGILEIHSFETNRPPGDIHEISAQTGPDFHPNAPKFSQMFGYFEARMKWTPGQGSWPAFWLASVAHGTWANWPDCPEPELNFELDILEWLGAEPENAHVMTHRNTGDVCGTPDETDGAAIDMNIDLSAGWHTYAVLWTASSIKWYIDDQLIRIDSALYDSADQEMYILLTMQACGWDPPNDCDGTTPEDLVTEVDWVRVWEQT